MIRGAAGAGSGEPMAPIATLLLPGSITPLPGAIAAVAAHTALAMASWNSTTEGGACTSSIKMPSPEFGVMWFPLG